MTLRDEMEQDFSEIHSDIPASVTLAGGTFSALVSEGELSERLDAGGFASVRSISVRVLKSSVPTAPKVGEKLTCDGVTYSISEITSKPGLPFLRLACQQE